MSFGGLRGTHFKYFCLIGVFIRFICHSTAKRFDAETTNNLVRNRANQHENRQQRTFELNASCTQRQEELFSPNFISGILKNSIVYRIQMEPQVLTLDYLDYLPIAQRIL